MIHRNLKEAGLLYFAAALFNKGIAFLTIPIFTRLLSPSDYGVVNTYNSWVDILTVFLSMALYMAIRTSYIDFPERKNEFLSTVMTFTFLLAFIAFMLTILLQRFIHRTFLYMIFLCILQGFSAAVLMNYSQFLMMDYKYRLRTMYMVLPNALSVVISIFSIIYVVKENLYNGRIVPTALVFVVCGAFIMIRTYVKSPPKIDLELLTYGLKISVPLVFHGIALSMLSQFDRTMIAYYADTSQTGIYSLVYNFSMITTVITIALQGLWLPWFMDSLKKKKYRIINKRARDYTIVMSTSIGALILVGPELLKFISDKTYWDGIQILPPLMISNYIIFAYTLYVNVEHFHKKTISIAVFTVIAAAVNVALNYLLIPSYGYIAAAYTTLFAYICCFFLHMINSQKLEKEALPVQIFMGSIFQLLLITTVFYFVIENWIIRWGLAILYVIIILYRERNKIFEFVTKKGC
jgi:O-antigen/teichoic acid export membrane protein